MAYVLTDGAGSVVTYPYSIGLLRRDNANVSFPANPTDAQLAEWNVYPVTATAQPSYNILTQKIVEQNPTLSRGDWVQVWSVVSLTSQEQADVLAQYQSQAKDQAEALFDATNYYLDYALTQNLKLHADMIAYRAALADYTNLPGYPANVTWPAFPSNIYGGSGLPINAYTKSEVDAAVAPLTVLPRLTINLQTSTGSITTDPVIANALTTIGTTNGYTINLGFGEYRETGPIVFDGKWQLQVNGNRTAGTTSTTIKNGITIQNSNGVRLHSLQIEGASSISSRAGLGLYATQTQFIGNVTLGGTGGFMIFTDCDFGANVTISSTFAGTIYFIRCAFSNASGVYTFSQTSALQAIISDSSGIPNTGITKASFSGMITYKNGTQAQFINGIPVLTAGATSGQVLKFNGTAFAPAADSATDSTKLPLAGGTMTGNLFLAGDPESNLHAATKRYVDTQDATKVSKAGDTMTGLLTLSGAPTNNLHAATKKYVDDKTANVLTTAGGTITGDLQITDAGYTFEVNPNLGTFYMVDGAGSNVEGGPGFISVVDGATQGSVLAQGGTLSIYADVNLGTAATPTAPFHAVTKQYVDDETARRFSNYGGTLYGEINMSNYRITDLGEPIAMTDAVSKGYVDTAISNIGGVAGDFLPTTGGTMSGEIDMSFQKIVGLADPEWAQDAANKQYVDTAVGDYLPLSGGTLTGSVMIDGGEGSSTLAAGYISLTDVEGTAATPTDPSHVATKAYVDSAVAGAGGGGGASNLDGLSDVVITSPQPQQILSYDGPSSSWKNTSLNVDSSIRPTQIAGLNSIGNNTLTGNSTWQNINNKYHFVFISFTAFDSTQNCYVYDSKVLSAGNNFPIGGRLQFLNNKGSVTATNNTTAVIAADGTLSDIRVNITGVPNSLINMPM